MACTPCRRKHSQRVCSDGSRQGTFLRMSKKLLKREIRRKTLIGRCSGSSFQKACFDVRAASGDCSPHGAARLFITLMKAMLTQGQSSAQSVGHASLKLNCRLKRSTRIGNQRNGSRVRTFIDAE